MKRFYDACHSALYHAGHGTQLGVTLWLNQAHKFRYQLVRRARARYEPRIIDELNGYLAMITKACVQRLADEEKDAALTLLEDKGLLRRIIPRYATWDKRVTSGSLAYRWGVHQESAT